MNDKNMSFSLNERIDIRSDGFDAFISYMEYSNDFWLIKDNESKFIYANNIVLHYCNFPKNFKIEGLLDSELPHPNSEFSDIIQANDKKVMETQKSVPVLNTFVYGGRDKLVQPFMVEVTPLIKDGKSIGVVAQGKRLEIYSMYHMEYNKVPDSLSFGKPTDLFTDREFDVIFFALQSLSVKEIAKKLKISHNTVDNYLHSVYKKTGVSALSQLIEYCRSNGYDKFAPSKFINPNPYIPLS